MKHGDTVGVLKRWMLWSVLMAGMLVGPVWGSTVIPPRDLGELARISDAVVLARAGFSSAHAKGGLIVTRTTFTVVEVMQGGMLAQRIITVETPGGVLDEARLEIAGSPMFAEGSVYLLFLNAKEGVWQPRMLAYGLLERVEGPDGSAMLMHVPEHHDLELLPRPDGIVPEPIGTYYEKPLLNHLREVAQARASWSAKAAAVPLELQPSVHLSHKTGNASIPEPCVYLSSQYPLRWDVFDKGGSVTIYATEGGDDDLDGNEFFLVEEAMRRWTTMADGVIKYTYGGEIAYTPDCGDDDSGLPNDRDDNEGIVQFNDPCGEIADLNFSSPTTCSGTLAIGGAFAYDTLHEHRGLQWYTNAVAFIIVNNKVGDCLNANQYRIMLTHEFGHTLGFGHVTKAQSTMNPTCCIDVTEADQFCAIHAYSKIPLRDAPAAIVLNTPGSSAANQPTSPIFSWQPDPEADFYELQVSTTSNFTNLVFKDVNITATSHQAGPFENDRTYYWRVRGWNPDAGEGPWSETRHFTTIATPPGEVTLRVPEADAPEVQTIAVFEWDETEGADRYYFQVSLNQAFTQLVFEDDDVTGTSLTVELAGETEHYWRMRAANVAGESPWSEVRRFTTLPPLPDAVVSVAPLHQVKDVPTTLTLEWGPTTEAEFYHLQISTDNTFDTRVLDEDELTETSLEVGPLADNRTHFWRVRALNRAGAGVWSSVRQFTTRREPPSMVTLLAPVDGATDQPNPALLEWQPDPRAAVYSVQVGTTEDFSDIIFKPAAITTTSVEVPDLPGSTTLYWRVRAVNAAGAAPWSPAYRFTTAVQIPVAVALGGPEDGSDGLSGTPTLAWTADPAIDTYQLQISTTENFSNIVFEREGLAEAEVKVGALAYNTRHYWRVRGTNAAGTGPWSAARAFTTGIGTGLETVDGELPKTYQFYPNYPNPFNPQTTLRFDLPETANVSLIIYDVLGRAVETLASGTLAAGRYTFAWEAANYPSGIYLAQFRAGTFTQTRRLMLLK